MLIVLNKMQFEVYSNEQVWKMTGGVDERVHELILQG